MVWTLTSTEPDLKKEPLDTLWRRLAETVAWCAPRADVSAPETSLRDPRLRPRIMQPSYAATVKDVAINRQLALGSRLAPSEDLAGGRILVYGPDEELSDGMAEQETRGYFDVANCPPWDTWLAMAEFGKAGAGRSAHLFSWVPAGFIELVTFGIEVNPEACILWLEDWREPAPSAIISALRRVSRREA